MGMEMLSILVVMVVARCLVVLVVLVVGLGAGLPALLVVLVDILDVQRWALDRAVLAVPQEPQG